MLELLDPQPGERILDLGCGEGTLTQQIAARGARRGRWTADYVRLRFKATKALEV